MNYELTETQKLIIESIRDFADKEIKPNIMTWDEDQIFPIRLS